MNTHDVLAYAVAQEAVRRIGLAEPAWTALSPASYITTSRVWPVPDFVLMDSATNVTIAAEFKPPRQSKREYLTGLGQASAYTRDFHYSLLVLPTVADDGYLIADHVVDVLNEPHFQHAPLGVIEYDPRTLSPLNPSFKEVRLFPHRASNPTSLVSVDQSFYAKWREMSPQEMYLLLAHSYDEMRKTSVPTNVRDRAFELLWQEIQAGSVLHWGGKTRNYNSSLKMGVNKNYRNFFFHIGWTDGTGALTSSGLQSLHTATLYGPWSEPFLDEIAKALLGDGKHLILFNAISEFQDALSTVPVETIWLDELETSLEKRGLLKRNPARHQAAVAKSARAFLKAEKQLWKNLRLIKPNGTRVFHPGRGFIFDWARITNLLQP